ncbi:MAG: DUF393 domain-containing protein [Acidobacteriota bacterium]
MPERTPILVFDGDCGFCTRSALWLRARLLQPVRLQPWQTTDLAALGLREEQTRRAAWWLDGARRDSGHRAIARALIACGAPWPLLGRLLLVPPISWAAALGYRLIARYRGLLPGTTPACRRPDWPPAE